MAKKKPAQHSKEPQAKQQPAAEAPPQLPHHRQSADSAAPISAATMGDSSEKLESLKAFNARLLKETYEGRRQIEALVQEKKSLEAELTRASEEVARFEVEKSVVRAFVESEVGKMEGLGREKSELLEKLVRVCEEMDLLKADLVETKKRERLVREESEKLKVRCKGMVVEKEDREALVEGLKKEKGSVERDLAESERAIEGLRAENERVSRAKSGLEAKVGALEKELGAESKVASGLRRELEAMQARVLELERCIGEGMGAMEAEVGALRDEKAEKEKTIKELEVKLREAETGWKRISVETDEKRLRIEELVREKCEIEGVKVGLESEIVRLSNEVGELRDALLNSRSFCRDREESNRKLVSEISDYKDALERVARERDEARKAFGEERMNTESLKLVVLEEEKRVEELSKELHLLRNENKSQEREIFRLRHEVGELRDALLDSRSSCRIQEESNMKLVSEVSDQKNALERVARERDEAQKSFHEEKKNVEDLKLAVLEKGKQVEEITKELCMLRNENKSQEREIFSLSHEVGALRDALLESRSSCRVQEESNMKLVSEVSDHKNALERVVRERDEARKSFDEERKNVEDLKLTVSEKGKRVEEISKELFVLREEKESLVEKAKAIESRLDSLVEERDSAQKSLLEAESRMKEWRVKVESAGIISERALTMLKKTASMVSAVQPEPGKKEAVDNEQKLEDEMQPYFAELEAIHSAFSYKQKIVEDLKQQVEALQRSVDEANRRKSFWTLVSSATTIFAAASVAYVAKAQR